MRLPLQITFRNLSRSQAVVVAVRKHARKLEHFSRHLMGCRVMIEAPQHSPQHKGLIYNVRIDLTLPGEEIVIHRAPWHHSANRNIYAGIRDAFRALERQIQDYEKRRRRTPIPAFA